MGNIVSKFGGTSLASAAGFLKVRDILLADGRRRYAVPSAPGKRSPDDIKVTDLLYMSQELSSRGEDYSPAFSLVRERFTGIVRELKLAIDMEGTLDEIGATIEAGASIDYAASRGEYLSGLILSSLLGWEFVDAFDIIHFLRSNVYDEERTLTDVRERLSGLEHAVIPGFYGERAGKVKTFSRGGSDISGAIVAAAVNAELYENWTDVPGFLMADPRIVDNPKTIKTITYKELRELSYMGAGVLHEDSIFPVRRAGVPVRIKNTFDPTHPGTLITRSTEGHTRGLITGIAGKKGFTVISLESSMMNNELGFGERVLGALAQLKVSFEHLPTGIDTMSVVVADTQLKNGMLQRIIERIKEVCSPDVVEIHSNLALLATVGHGMANTPGVAAKLFGSLAGAGISVRMIDQGSSEMNIIVGVENEDFENAMRAVYQGFVD